MSQVVSKHTVHPNAFEDGSIVDNGTTLTIVRITPLIVELINAGRGLVGDDE